LGGGEFIRFGLNFFVCPDDLAIVEKGAEYLNRFLILEMVKPASQHLPIAAYVLPANSISRYFLTVCPKALLQFRSSLG
jgi:hypothetical protein